MQGYFRSERNRLGTWCILWGNAHYFATIELPKRQVQDRLSCDRLLVVCFVITSLRLYILYLLTYFLYFMTFFKSFLASFSS